MSKESLKQLPFPQSDPTTEITLLKNHFLKGVNFLKLIPFQFTDKPSLHCLSLFFCLGSFFGGFFFFFLSGRMPSDLCNVLAEFHNMQNNSPQMMKQCWFHDTNFEEQRLLTHGPTLSQKATQANMKNNFPLYQYSLLLFTTNSLIPSTKHLSKNPFSQLKDLQ